MTRYPVGINVTAVNDVRCLFIKSQALLAMFDSEKVSPFQARFDQRYRARVLRSHLQRVDLFANAAPAVMDAVRARNATWSISSRTRRLPRKGSRASFSISFAAAI